MTVSGVCSDSSVNGVYAHSGVTQSGTPFYKHTSSKWFLYYDPDCNGYGTQPRWIFDANEPSLTAAYDLDGDADCHYFGRKDAEQSSQLPWGTSTWKMACEKRWADVQVTLTQGALEEESDILTSTWALVVYAVVSVMLTILCVCVAWKCRGRRSRRSPSHEEPAAASSAKDDGDDHAQDIESGRICSQRSIEARHEIPSTDELSECCFAKKVHPENSTDTDLVNESTEEPSTAGASLSDCRESKEVDLDDLSNAGIFQEPTEADLIDISRTGLLPDERESTAVDLDDLRISFPEEYPSML